MRVSVIHSFYRTQQPSGENLVVGQQADLLDRAGVDVGMVARYSDDLGLLGPVTSAVTVASGLGQDPTAELRSQNPDVVHVHNLFPNFGTRWLRGYPRPIVVTVHNYRPLCANGLLLRDGHFCRACLDSNTSQAVRHGCYRDSRLASVPLAIATRGGARRNPLLRRADAVVVLSEVQREIYAAAGLDPGKVHIVPHGLPDRAVDSVPGDGWLFIGRLTAEKGLADLLSDWPADIPLTVIGQGPLRDCLHTVAGSQVTWRTGGPHEVAEALAAAQGLVFPSLAVETMSLVVIEALRAGTPVVARRGTVAAELVRREGAGAVYDGGRDSLREALNICRQAGPALRAAARSAYEAEFTEQLWLERMLALYASLV
jgi:glycosyltransferase involved in cell wall biosynthesis